MHAPAARSPAERQHWLFARTTSGHARATFNGVGKQCAYAGDAQIASARKCSRCSADLASFSPINEDRLLPASEC